MPDNEFTIEMLRRILRQGAGEEVDLDGDILDVTFAELGYESLALLETGGRIEREFDIRFDDDALVDAATPRALVDLVNSHLLTRN